MSEQMPKIEPPLEMSKRLEQLRGSDSEYTDSVISLAGKEDVFRTKHLVDAIPGESEDAIEKRNRIADAFSDEVLQAMEAERAIRVDALTGLLNRRALIQELPRFLGREMREEGGKGALLMVDFDHFKQVNDLYGHPAGDDALRQMAEILRDVVRPLDQVYRYGGEEFVVYLPKTSVGDASHVAEHIRKKIAETPIVVTDTNQVRHSLEKTVSIGCVGLDTAEVRESYRDLFDLALKKEKTTLPAEAIQKLTDTLIGYADIALFAAKSGVSTYPDEAKRNGRNQVVQYTGTLPKRNLSPERNN